MIYLNPTFLFTSRSAVFQVSVSSSWLQIPSSLLCHRMGVWDGTWPHTGDPAALTTSPEDGLSAYIVFWMFWTFLSTVRVLSILMFGGVPCFHGRFQFPYQSFTAASGFYVAFGVGKCRHSPSNCKTDSGGMCKSQRFSWLTFLLSAAHLVLLLCAEYLFFQAPGLHSDVPVPPQQQRLRLLGRTGEIQFGSTGRSGESLRGGNNLGPITSEHRKGAGTGHWCFGKCWEGKEWAVRMVWCPFPDPSPSLQTPFIRMSLPTLVLLLPLPTTTSPSFPQNLGPLPCKMTNSPMSECLGVPWISFPGFLLLTALSVGWAAPIPDHDLLTGRRKDPGVKQHFWLGQLRSGSCWWLRLFGCPWSLTLVCASALGEPGWLLVTSHPHPQNSCFRSSWNMAENFIWDPSIRTSASHQCSLVPSYSDYSVNSNTLQGSRHNMMRKESQKCDSRFYCKVYTSLM